jgi:uncharacterized membrane protein YkoI
MRTHTLIASLALGTALLGASALSVPVFAQGNAAPTAQTGAQTPILSLQQIQAKLEAEGYRDFEKIERERNNRYEVKALDPQGRRVEVEVDARSGEILETEIKRNR